MITYIRVHLFKTCNILLFLLLFWFVDSEAQTFKFAHVTDTHIGGATAEEDLKKTVADLNTQDDLDFVIITGDITEFGSDEELRLAKQILDQIQLPWYVIPGNHDTNWSESGGNSFRTVFGGETFAFKHKGFWFVGTNSGPNMRMSPGQVPRENLVWMDSLFNANSDVQTPLIYINHYPQDSSLNNWFEAIDRIKTRNIQLILCGHGHQNKEYDFDGIPGVMGRSNLRAHESIGGYNIVTITGDEAIYEERIAGSHTKPAWAIIPLKNHGFEVNAQRYPRPYYAVNDKYSSTVNKLWEYQDDSDVGAGMAVYKNQIITSNTKGEIYAIDSRNGERLWAFQTDGKIYATPAIWKNYVIVGSSDHVIYCLNIRNGKLVWKYKADKAVLGSSLVHAGRVYIGASDGKFRSFDIKSGKLIWSFDEVKGYVSGKPLLYNNTLYFGCWGNGFYALNPETGEKLWSWSNGSPNRMLSPAACYPVGAYGKVFIVAPDRYMTALDAGSGTEIWRRKINDIRVRESMGLSADSQYVYVKTMDGQLLGVSTTTDSMDVAWKSTLQLPYELTPSAISADADLVYVPSHAGLLSAVDTRRGHVVWQYKISNAMINPVLLLKKNRIIASTMDGKIVCLQY